MDYAIISYLANLVIPLNLSLSLAAIAILLMLLRKHKQARKMLLFAIIWSFAWSLPITTILLGGHLEKTYPYKEPQQHMAANAIVVLGGNTANSRGNWFEPPTDETAVLRSDIATDLYFARLAPLIILSGAAFDGGISEAEIMANQMENKGIPNSAIIEETNSHTTYENALYTAKIINNRQINSFLLVTSSLHMPRAYASFKKLGLNPIAAPTPPQITNNRHNSLWLWLPDGRTFNASKTIIKEYLAIILYKLRGWI